MTDRVTDLTAPPFPAVDDYDESLPTDLLVRWTGLDSDRVVLADLGRSLATWAGVAVSLVGIAALVFGSIGIAASLAVTLAGLLVTVGSVLVGQRLRRRTGLRGKDIDLVLAHRREIRFESWNDLAGRDRPARSWPEEARLAHRAAQALTAIRATTIWSEPDLSDHRLRLDPIETSRQIHVAAWRINTVRRQLGSRPGDAAAAPIAAEWDLATSQLEQSLRVLRGHVDQVESYRDAVESTDRRLLLERRHTELRDLAERATEQLSGQDARHELAAEHLAGLRHEIEPPPGR